VKIVRQVRVRNNLGLHIRPAAIIVRMLQTCKSSVFFSYKNETVNAKNIMSILTLAAKKDAKITITVEGEDAQNAMENLIKAFDTSFGEK
jgi:phosphocarrier protein HPr